ncbi:MAG: heavy-metal-associated domain-containing protein [Chloroflexales bacterium]|nr:heavy-metal-associated domain-containing protein [Chloroflexales bacterium]
MARKPQASGAVFGFWGALAGAVGSLCCVGPGAAVLLGLGTSSALWGVQLSRPLAWVLGGALLTLGVALALRSSRSCAVPSARWRQPALLLASGALAYALLGALLPIVAARKLEAASPAPVAVQPAASPTRRLTLNVAKMECLPCVTALQGLLRKQPGVRSFFAESEVERVTIDYDAAQLSPAQLLRKIPPKYDAQVVGDAPLK